MAEAARVLYLSPSGQVGGAERSLVTLASQLERARYQPSAIVCSPGPLAGLLAEAGVTAQLLPLPGGMRRFSRFHANAGAWAKLAPVLETPGFLWRLDRGVNAVAPALVHSNGLKTHLLAALLPSRRAPLIWHLRDFPPERGPASDSPDESYAGKLIRRLSGRPALVIANSEAVDRAYRERYPALGPKLRVVHNGVAIARFQAARGGALRARLGFAAGDFLIGMVAVFAPWKGHEVFLRAARLALNQAPELKFLLVGDDIYDTTGHGERRRELETMAADLNLTQAVRFSGYLGDDIPEAYAALDVLVHASTRPEPFGRTIIEAMAAHVPVIASGQGGVREIITGPEEGILIPAGEPDALAAAMLQLYRNGGMRQRMQRAGAARVAAAFSEEAHARAVMALYDDLLGAG